MTIFYLIRHGETEWNLTGRWQGYADEPLNDTGRAQAQRLAERLHGAGIAFHALYSSDLLRAWETARTVGMAVGLAPQPLLALREINVSAWSGLTGAEVRTRDPEIFARIESGEDLPRGGGERFADLYRRVVGAVELLSAEHPHASLAIVTHGGPVRAILLHAARDKYGTPIRRLHIGNTSISVVVCDQAGWELGVINDMTHLEANHQAPDMMSAPPDDAERP